MSKTEKPLSLKRRGTQITWASQMIELANQYRASRVVMVASKVGLFQKLRARTPVAAVAAELKLDPAVTERMLIVLAALDLADREGDQWKLTSKAEAVLLPESPYYQGNGLAHLMNVWEFWHDLEHVLRGQKGTAVFAEGKERARSHRDFILAMHNFAMAGRAAEMASRVDLKGKKTLVDVGGGPGTYAIALCQKFRDLKAVVFDLPETTAIAREVIERFNLAGRITTRDGSWDTDEFGQNADVVMMSNILHGPGSDAEMKLAKAFKALVPGGVLIVQDFLLNNEKTGPLAPALFNLMLGAYSLDEMLDLMKQAGFVDLRDSAMPEDLGTTLIVASRPA